MKKNFERLIAAIDAHQAEQAAKPAQVAHAHVRCDDCGRKFPMVDGDFKSFVCDSCYESEGEFLADMAEDGFDPSSDAEF